jgi:hypothetical protein
MRRGRSGIALARVRACLDTPRWRPGQAKSPTWAGRNPDSPWENPRLAESDGTTEPGKPEPGKPEPGKPEPGKPEPGKPGGGGNAGAAVTRGWG